MSKRQLGTDINGLPLFEGDTVMVDGAEPMVIEFKRHRERFGCGDVWGFYIPDYCEKIESNPEP